METGIDMDPFVTAVLSGLGAPEDFVGNTYFAQSPSPTAHVMPQPHALANNSTQATLDFEAFLNSLQWEDVKTTLTTTVEDLLADTSLVSTSQSLPLLPSAAPCDLAPDMLHTQPLPQLEAEPEPELALQCEPVESQAVFIENFLEKPDVNTCEQTTHGVSPQISCTLPAPVGNYYPPQNSAHCSQPVTSQLCPQPMDNQYVNYVPQQQVPATVGTTGPQFPAALQLMNGNQVVPASMLRPVCVINGQMMYAIIAEPSASNSVAPVTPINVTSRKRQRDIRDNDEKPYIKRPPNAFMLFRAEQRQKVMEELNIRDSATVNSILGQRWKMLSAEGQAKYFDQARIERILHEEKYPDWSPKDNYGKKKKKQKTN